MTKLTKYFSLLAAVLGGSLLTGCLGGIPGAVFDPGNEFARGLWLALNEMYVTG